MGFIIIAASLMALGYAIGIIAYCINSSIRLRKWKADQR